MTVWSVRMAKTVTASNTPPGLVRISKALNQWAVEKYGDGASAWLGPDTAPQVGHIICVWVRLPDSDGFGIKVERFSSAQSCLEWVNSNLEFKDKYDA